MGRAHDPVTAFADQVVRGKIPAGVLVRLACERSDRRSAHLQAGFGCRVSASVGTMGVK